ncbi:DUF6328 family protein [Streptomyces hoynatensis]|uniref:Sodium:proton antiporter n=1 Tax=Streptomyces hoynatensis TaxID=1141874 RepID=A0A3A9YPL6_9ACTN|nr:DUF6328 family protein [Streptomyces hoynatensis]RKN37106.1 hypothetical protein D7294_28930 [Streptomyces hoynatensis]
MRNASRASRESRAAAGRGETPLERADRNFAELLQELRVTQTGVQILFAFLLTLPFGPRFPSLDTVQRTTYVVTLLLALVASILLTAPAAVHRALFQRGAKELIVGTSSRLASAGLAALALSFTGALLLVVDVVLNRTAGIVAAAGAFVLCCGLWAALPRRLRRVGPRR